MSAPAPAPTTNPATANLDASKVSETSLAEAAFPGQFQRDFRIHWDEKVHDEVIKHAAETTNVELCGVLMGKVLRDRDGPYLTIVGSIRGEQAKHDGAQVTFTHDTWDHIHKVKDEKFPKEQIVGWSRTHPGFGIFLSGMDVFIHEFFFNGATQIAHVIDPRTGDEGAFLWKAGKVERVPRFWIGTREKACATGPTGQRPMAASVSVAGTPQALAAAPRRERDPDEFDIVKLFWDWLNWFAPYGIACMFGYLLHFFMSGLEVTHMRDEAFRAEVRSLVGSEASAWATTVEMRSVQDRIDALAAASPSAAEQKGLKELSADLATLRSATLVREERVAQAVANRLNTQLTIEDDVRSAHHGVNKAQQLAFTGFIEALRVRVDLDVLESGGKEISETRRAARRQELESTLRLVGLELDRELLRQRFPELYPPPPPAPDPVGPEAPKSKDK